MCIRIRLLSLARQFFEDFWGMPGGLFSAIYYVIFFGAGVVARRNSWLDAVPKLPLKQAAFCIGAATLLALGALYQASAVSYWGSPSYDRESAALFKGIMPMAIILSELIIFQRYFNRGGWIAIFFVTAFST